MFALAVTITFIRGPWMDIEAPNRAFRLQFRTITEVQDHAG
jgi:hypothetical protein